MQHPVPLDATVSSNNCSIVCNRAQISCLSVSPGDPDEGMTILSVHSNSLVCPLFINGKQIWESLILNGL